MKNNTVILKDFKELKKFKLWTKRDNNRLRELYAAKKSDKEIADLLGRTVSGIEQQRSKIGATKFRHKRKRHIVAEKRPVVVGGSLPKASKPKLPLDIEALKTTQLVLKSLGYKLIIARITEGN